MRRHIRRFHAKNVKKPRIVFLQFRSKRRLGAISRMRELCKQKNCKCFAQFCACDKPVSVIWLIFVPASRIRRGGRVDKAAAKEMKGPGFESGLDLNFFSFFFFGACVKYFLLIFCVNLTYALTHASNLRNFAKTYNARKLDAQSAHVARLRRYCAQ